MELLAYVVGLTVLQARVTWRQKVLVWDNKVEPTHEVFRAKDGDHHEI